LLSPWHETRGHGITNWVDALLGVTCRFHVEKVSSAHVYLRLKKGETIDSVREGLLEDCAQLVKAHSVQGTSLF
jgi:hypothetical protein